MQQHLLPFISLKMAVATVSVLLIIIFYYAVLCPDYTYYDMYIQGGPEKMRH